jgi:hypothetical protein
MLVFYAFEYRSPWYVLAFAGAWPFGVVEAIWAGVAVHRWRMRVNG